MIRRHAALLLSLEDSIGTGFYDTLYAHPQTAAILQSEQRQQRETVLRNWWQKTINGNSARLDFSRKLKWDPSDFSSEK